MCSASEFLFDMTEASDDFNPCVLSPSEQKNKNILTLRLILNVFILLEHVHMGILLIGLSSVINQIILYQEIPFFHIYFA